MRLRLPARLWRVLAIAAGLGVAAFLLRRPIAQVLTLAAGGAAMAFLLTPLARWLEGGMSRSAAALLALGAALGMITGLLWLLLPMLVREAAQLMDTLPDSLAVLGQWSASLRDWLARRLPEVQLPGLPLDRLTGLLTGITGGMLSFAGSFADAVSRLSLMAMLCWFFLCDRDSLLLRLELLVPQAFRGTAVRMGGAVAREVRLYLQGQLLVAAAVGALTALGLGLIGVRSAVMLGGIVGVLNMVPYFGPFIGGVPALLIALGGGWRKALLCLGVLVLVQQLDSAIISPRVMGSLTGFSPAAVLIAIYAGAGLGGIGGMLLALPVMMSGRTLFRVLVQHCENN